MSLASPSEIAAVAAVVGWPLMAGLGVVLWSRRRAAERRRRLEAVDRGLTTLFRSVEGEPAPDRLTLVVEALEEAEAMKPAPAAAEPAPKTPLSA